MRTPSSPSSMSSSVPVSSNDRQRYFSSRPGFSSVPVTSSPGRRRSLTSPVSFTMRANCPAASKKRAAVSRFTSLGMIKPRHSDEKLLCIRIRSLVVLVRYR